MRVIIPSLVLRHPEILVITYLYTKSLSPGRLGIWSNITLTQKKGFTHTFGNCWLKCKDNTTCYKTGNRSENTREYNSM